MGNRSAKSAVAASTRTNSSCGSARTALFEGRMIGLRLSQRLPGCYEKPCHLSLRVPALPGFRLPAQKDMGIDRWRRLDDPGRREAFRQRFAESANPGQSL